VISSIMSNSHSILKNRLLILSFALLLVGTAFLIRTQEIKAKTSKQYTNDKDDLLDSRFLISSSPSDYEFEWYRTIGGVYDDDCRGVAVDSTDSIYVVGWQDITGSGTNRDVVITKYNSMGQRQWIEYWGGSNDDIGYDLVIDDLDYIYVVGLTKSMGDNNGDFVIIKYNSDGQQQWYITWGGSNYDVPGSIAIDGLNNFYITGISRSFGDVDGDAILVKFNNSWQEQWYVTWGGSNSEDCGDIVVESNDEIYISGRTDSYGSGGDAFLVKYNSAGVLQWQRTWGTSYAQIFSGIATDSLHNIYAVGMTFGHPASSGKGLIVKYNSEGTYQWERIWGVDGSYNNYMYRLIIDSKDNLYIAGLTYSYGTPNNEDAILFNYDTSGNQLWYKTWSTSEWDLVISLCIDSNWNLYLVGNTRSYSTGGSDILLLKCTWNSINPSDSSLLMTIFNITIILACGVLYAVLLVLRTRKR
jgi:hypothetical protein